MDNCHENDPNGSGSNVTKDYCKTEIKIKNKGPINIYSCVSQPSQVGPEEKMPEICPPTLPPTGACVPFAVGHKPKKKLEDRIRPYLEQPVPSVLASAFFQTARRFLNGRTAENDLEAKAFERFRQLSKKGRDVLGCATGTFGALPTDDQQRLFIPGMISDLDQPITPEGLTELLADELVKRTSLAVFDDADCLDAERPGQARPTPGIEPGEVFFTPTICKVNGLRTNAFKPSIPLGEYRTEEIQQVCTPEVDDSEVRLNCSPQTEPCPGNDIDGTCLRVPEVRPGETVVLSGFNFFNVDGRVRLQAKPPGTLTRIVDAHVCGDIETPLTEVVGGRERPIADCRVNDQLAFRVPDDLPDGIYGVVVLMPNNTGIGTVTEFISFGEQFIRVLPPVATTFQIASERLKCIEETSPAAFGSDEVGIRFVTVPFDTSLNPADADNIDFRFDNVDSGDERTMSRLLFQGSDIGGVAMAIIGFEIDNESAFRDQIEEFAEAFVLYLQDAWHVFAESFGAAVGGLTAVIFGLSAGWAAAIAAAIVVAIGIFFALWAPADLIIEDTIGLTVLDLSALTSPNFPAPPEVTYTTPGDIRVRISPVSKGIAYNEQRHYRSDDEDSRYRIFLRYNRL